MTSAVRDPRLILAAVLVVLALASGCAGQQEQHAARPSVSAASAGPQTRTPAPAPATAAAVGGDGSYRTGERQVTFTEPARTGPAGQHLGRRTLVTQIRYPRARGPAGPFPLLLFAPGFLQCPGAYSDLLQAWASAGYVVAAVTFPRTNCHLGPEADETDLVNQPQDMSYVLARLLALSARPGDPFSGLLDPHAVGAAGQSDGGDTVAALAASTCCTDRRRQGRGRAVRGGVAADAGAVLPRRGTADAVHAGLRRYDQPAVDEPAALPRRRRRRQVLPGPARRRPPDPVPGNESGRAPHGPRDAGLLRPVRARPGPARCRP